MKKAAFEQRLQEALHQLPTTVSERHFADTLLLARKEACRKQYRERISFTQFLTMQIKFIGWKIWTAQGIFLLLIRGLLANLYGRNHLENPQSMVRVLFCLSVLVFMTALPFLYRSARYQMQETEAAARFSSVKLLLAKLIVIGIGDVSMLSGIFLTAIVKTSLQADRALLYLCFPFLLAGSGCLFMLGHFSPKPFFVGSMGLCSFLVLTFSILPQPYESLFQQSFSAGWLVICVLLAAFCIQQLRHILYHSFYTEMQIA